MFGGVEAGGTKFNCIVGTGPDDIVETARFETTGPDETLDAVVDFFVDASAATPLAAIGVGSFGPVDLHPGSRTYGRITATPKPGWSDTDIVGRLRDGLQLPIGFDTDVSAAALAEHRWGAGRGVDDLVYVTVGTGIGGGALIRGEVVHGAVHPEMGHLFVPRRPDDGFTGSCSFHGDCLEGLASGTAIGRRWGLAGVELAEDHPAWDLEAHYLALGLVNLILTLSPQRIVMGGGVMGQRQLFPAIRDNVQALLDGYVAAPQLNEGIDDFIVSPELGGRSGMLGALVLAERAA